MRHSMQRKRFIQTLAGRGLIPVLAPLVFLAVKLLGFKVRRLPHIRRSCRKYFDEHPGPWLICANHLTMIDSVILAYAILPFYRYIVDFQSLPWNVPERKNFQRSFLSSFLCYCLKCIPIDRRGDRDQVRKTLATCTLLLQQGQRLVLFPEGTRSRSGRVSTREFSYGVGRLLMAVPDCRVLCIYVRGDHQDSYSNIPRYGEVFSVTTAVIQPGSKHSGLRAQRDIAGQIIRHLAGMEQAYFGEHRQ